MVVQEWLGDEFHSLEYDYANGRVYPYEYLIDNVEQPLASVPFCLIELAQREHGPSDEIDRKLDYAQRLRDFNLMRRGL